TATPAFFVRVTIAWLIVDPLWGAFWRQIHYLTLLPHVESNAVRDSGPPLPYAQAEAPLSRLWRWMQGERAGIMSRDIWLALLLATFLSAWLHPLAVLATAAFALTAVLSTAVLPVAPAWSRLLAAFAAIAIPWWLGLNLFSDGSAWRWPREENALAWGLMALFTLLLFAKEQWQSGSSKLGQWGIGVLLVIMLFVFGKPIVALSVAVILFLSLWRAQRAESLWLEIGQWLALLLAVGQ
ncbi:MAG: hypothetical protein GXP38_09685, partial [Chloroflexi bacterium]|nr:hypothetical protein [Chloroflexota bacterium]